MDDLLGSAQVSTLAENPNLQLDALRTAGSPASLSAPPGGRAPGMSEGWAMTVLDRFRLDGKVAIVTGAAELAAAVRFLVVAGYSRGATVNVDGGWSIGG